MDSPFLRDTGVAAGANQRPRVPAGAPAQGPSRMVAVGIEAGSQGTKIFQWTQLARHPYPEPAGRVDETLRMCCL